MASTSGTGARSAAAREGLDWLATGIRAMVASGAMIGLVATGAGASATIGSFKACIRSTIDETGSIVGVVASMGLDSTTGTAGAGVATSTGACATTGACIAIGSSTATATGTTGARSATGGCVATGSGTATGAGARAAETAGAADAATGRTASGADRPWPADTGMAGLPPSPYAEL